MRFRTKILIFLAAVLFTLVGFNLIASYAVDLADLKAKQTMRT